MNNVIRNGGFAHAVSAAPLERLEPEISCMERQSCLQDGAPVKALDTEPGVSSVSRAFTGAPACRHD